MSYLESSESSRKLPTAGTRQSSCIHRGVHVYTYLIAAFILFFLFACRQFTTHPDWQASKLPSTVTEGSYL